MDEDKHSPATLELGDGSSVRCFLLGSPEGEPPTPVAAGAGARWSSPPPDESERHFMAGDSRQPCSSVSEADEPSFFSIPSHQSSASGGRAFSISMELDSRSLACALSVPSFFLPERRLSGRRRAICGRSTSIRDGAAWIRAVAESIWVWKIRECGSANPGAGGEAARGWRR